MFIFIEINETEEICFLVFLSKFLGSNHSLLRVQLYTYTNIQNFR